MTPDSLQARVDALSTRILSMPSEQPELLDLQLRLLRAVEPPAEEQVPRSDVVVVN